jgi:hypothetical protein
MTDLQPTLTLPLRKPLIEGDGPDAVTISSLALREPTAGEMRRAEGLGGNIPITLRVLALVSGVREALIRTLGARDLRAAGDYCAAFVVAALPDLGAVEDESRDFPLDPPVRGPAGLVDVIRLREPTAGQLDQYEHLEGWARRVAAIATVGGVPEQVADLIPVRKAAEMEAWLDRFFAFAPPGGVTS